MRGAEKTEFQGALKKVLELVIGQAQLLEFDAVNSSGGVRIRLDGSNAVGHQETCIKNERVGRPVPLWCGGGLLDGERIFTELESTEFNDINKISHCS